MAAIMDITVTTSNDCDYSPHRICMRGKTPFKIRYHEW